MTQVKKAYSKSGCLVGFLLNDDERRKKKTKRFFNASVFQPSNLFPVTPLSFQFFNYAWFVFGSPGGLETAKIFELERNEEAGTKASKVRLGDFEGEGNLFLFSIFFRFFN